ncbi:MAG: hypothetical protein M3P27_01240 [Acidobacteriota bacterium]|nr:hypothetical protein [Acidobacteriota bacterium]
MSVLLAFLLTPFLFCQSKPESETPTLKDKSFVELTDLRQKLEKEIQLQQQEVDVLAAKLLERENLERETGFLEKTYQNVSPEIPLPLKNAYKAQAKEARARLDNAKITEPKEKLDRDLDNKKAELQKKKREKENVEWRISELIDIERPRQEFKKTMSLDFSFLVGLVILGFFVVSWRDPVVRRSIFAGQSGIQFITLFSLVISIILFGITGILQDKELAALLGGLSGYILGRGASGMAHSNEANEQRSHE